MKQTHGREKTPSKEVNPHLRLTKSSKVRQQALTEMALLLTKGITQQCYPSTHEFKKEAWAIK